MNKATKKKWLRYLLSLGILAFFLWLVIRQLQNQNDLTFEWQTFLNRLKKAPPSLLILALLLAPANWTLEALKWKLLTQRLETLSLRQAFVAVFSGIAFAFITPNKTGDFIGRIYFLKKRNRLRGSLAALTGGAAQITVSFLFGFTGLLYLFLKFRVSWALPVLLLTLLALFLFFYLFFRIGWLSRWVRTFIKIRELSIAFQLFRRFSFKELFGILALSFARFLVYTFQFIVLLRALGSPINFIDAFWLTGLMFWFITIIPSFFIADLGIRAWVTILVFLSTGVLSNPFEVLAANYGVWLINLALPALCGSFFIFWESISRAKY